MVNWLTKTFIGTKKTPHSTVAADSANETPTQSELLNESSMRDIKTRVIYDACPLCKAKEIQTLLTADCSKHPLYNHAISPTMTWRKCVACQHIFTDGYFTENALEIIFGKTHEYQKVGFDAENQRYVSARMIEKVLPYAQTGDWLDVGFGNGSLLFTADEYGFTPVGVDLRKDNVEALKNIGIEAYSIDIAELKQAGRFTVISLADVLEHMPYPGDSLRIVHSLLNSNGVLFLSLPNADSILWEALNENNHNPYWGELEHYHNFGRKRLYQLLRDSGFEPVRFGISERYRVCMEVVAKKLADTK